MREGVVLYDRAGREIWACPNVDSRSADEAADLIREGAAEKIYAEAGDWVSITTPARLRWLARHRPDILDAAGGLGMLSDWIVYRLCGAAGHRAILRVQLGDVHARPADLVGVDTRRSAACPRTCCRPWWTPARWSAR